ncbi:uncharacterized protein J8A68_005994 [[Candida] subhashii]|uniref:Uncharacterized protein n=1 Tax=[Candida] subhashii TaxID=561895 RepID=A0A8J5QCY6_9ASCO|nr:uncharacterized protein J8A68_005994 [[Candida] subhashii]KAG7660493.1 hypothetical protein J8A68_005994 [[Candida] subhashii]
MSGAGNREQVFPTPLTKRFRDITQRIDKAKRKMGRVIKTFSLAEIQYATGDNIGYQVQESVQKARFSS